MSDGTTTWTYSYDANGMRTGRTNSTDSYSYTYNGSQLVQMTAGSDTLHFTYGASGPISVIWNGTTYYYVTNLQGDVVAIVNSSGTEVASYAYDAWGNLIATYGCTAGTIGYLNPLRYRGYVYDQETGLYYLNSRYHNPEMGRFINADAFNATGQGLIGNNMFAYCNNNPLIFYDPSGTRFVINDPVSAFGDLRNDGNDGDIHFTASAGCVFAFGIGPLSASLQFSVVSDSSGNSELQISYTAPNIFNTGLPSVDEMLAVDSDWKFNLAVAGTMSLTNASNVKDLYGPSYSIGGSIPYAAVDYNIIPIADDLSQAYSGVTLSFGLITPGFNFGMSNTAADGVPLPFTVFDLADAAYKGFLGVQ